jgi:ribonuclease Y
MGLPAVYLVLITFVVTLSVAGSGFAWWLSAQKRAAADGLTRAQADADRLVRQAERDAETIRKEAALEAREKAHELAAQADAQARDRRQEILDLEQALADKTRGLADRLAATDRLEQELRGREKALIQQQEEASSTRQRAEQLLVERQRELQRVAGLTADEARELLLKQRPPTS